MTKYLTLSALIALGLAFTSCTSLMPATGTQTAGQTTSASTSGSTLGDVLGNILASVTGSITTTQANLVGTWTYTAPSVQFESENLLAQAGGSAAAAQIESQLASIYSMVGIKSGSLVFAFRNDGQMTYQVGGYAMSGTYVFDSANKVVKITTATGLSLNAYVTISGNNLSLCFDSSKLLALLGTMGSGSGNSGILGSIGSIAGSFSGMKVGFKFAR